MGTGRYVLYALAVAVAGYAGATLAGICIKAALHPVIYALPDGQGGCVMTPMFETVPPVDWVEAYCRWFAPTALVFGVAELVARRVKAPWSFCCRWAMVGWAAGAAVLVAFRFLAGSPL